MALCTGVKTESSWRKKCECHRELYQQMKSLLSLPDGLIASCHCGSSSVNLPTLSCCISGSVYCWWQEPVEHLSAPQSSRSTRSQRGVSQRDGTGLSEHVKNTCIQLTTEHCIGFEISSTRSQLCNWVVLSTCCQGCPFETLTYATMNWHESDKHDANLVKKCVT